VSSNLTLIVVLTSVIHVAALVVMIWIRVRRTEGDGLPVENAKVTPCALCGEPATGWTYDGLDPNEQRDPHTGKSWSADLAHYRPVCAAHDSAGLPVRVVELGVLGREGLPGAAAHAGDQPGA
jgi:hypothetical protein